MRGPDTKAKWRLSLALVFGVVIGVAAISVLHAQGTTPGYVVGEFDITDQGTYQTYASQVPSTVAPFNGRYLVRGGKTDSLEGAPPKRIVIIAFDSVATARQWHDSPAYQAIDPIRQRSATSRVFIVEGASP